MPSSTDTSERPNGITCEKYVRGEGKRCRQYLPNGACSLPGEFMCSEWLKKNSPRPPQTKDLFGNPLPDPTASKQAQPEPANVEQPGVVRPGLTAEDVESFKALRIEVCIRSDALGEIWLVPAYTDQARKEITLEHVASIGRVLDAFPGSRVMAFEKKPPVAPPEGSPT